MWISTSQLEEGMMVDRDVKMNDIMLVKQNTPLSGAHIRSLQRWNVTKVSIAMPEDEAENSLDSEGELDGTDKRLLTETIRIDRLFQHVEEDAQMGMIKKCVLAHMGDIYGNG